MKGGLDQLMKQAQRMQAEMQKAQEQIANLEIIGSAGGGMVNITINGRHETLRVQLDDEALKDDKDMLEDLIAAAFNDAVHKLAAAQQERMASVTAGLPLPPGMKLPF
jgi:hypothetical protein